MKNKRKSKRLDCLVPVEAKKGSIYEKAKTVNISKTGIGFISSSKMPINKEIPIELDMGEEAPILVVGKVKWNRRIKETESYRVGVIFKEVLKGSKTRLSKHFKNDLLI